MHILHLSDFLYAFPFQISLPFSEIFSAENVFITFIALLWLIIASAQDFRNREVENWWSFGMISFVLAFRAFVSAENMSFMPFVWGLIGLIAGFLIMNAFYYARMFAGGDAKVIMALCTVLPLSLDWRVNLVLILAFIFLVLIIGGIYGIIYSAVLTIANYENFKAHFSSHFNKHKQASLFIFIFSFIILTASYALGFYFISALAALMAITPLLLIYAKSIEECCMIAEVPVNKLTVGDWIVNPVRAGYKIIRPYWEGLSEDELKLIQKKCQGKKILVKSGIPFVPVFLFAFIALLIMI